MKIFAPPLVVLFPAILLALAGLMSLGATAWLGAQQIAVTWEWVAEDPRVADFATHMTASMVGCWLLCIAAVASAIGLGRSWSFAWYSSVGFLLGIALAFLLFPRSGQVTDFGGALWFGAAAAALLSKAARSYAGLLQMRPLLLLSVPGLLAFGVCEAIVGIGLFWLSVPKSVEALSHV